MKIKPLSGLVRVGDIEFGNVFLHSGCYHLVAECGETYYIDLDTGFACVDIDPDDMVVLVDCTLEVY